MTAGLLLDRLGALGVSLHAEQGRLRYRAPKGVMTPELLQEIKSLERELLAALSPAASPDIPRVADAADYELSDAQRRLWVLHQLDPASAAYHVPLVHTLDGALDAAAIAAACDLLVARHEMLRARFVVSNGVPRLQIAPRTAAILTVIDLSAHADADARAQDQVRRTMATPFDLAAGPLARLVLIRVGRTRHVLAIVLHHLIADGVSVAVLMQELGEAYAACREGRPPQLAPLPVRYRDYAAWHNASLAGPAAITDRAYWQRQLAAPLARLDLPTDYARPATASSDGREETFHVDRETVAALRRLAAAHGATLFIGLLAAVKTLLHRYTGLEDIIVGTPVAGRAHPDVAGVVGIFINTLVLRDRIRGAMSFADVLDAVRQTAAEAFDHQSYPFDRLVQDLDTDRDPSRSPLFDVMLILQSQQTSRFELPGLHVTPRYEHTGTSKLDLTFNFHESDEGLSLGIEYRTSLFSRERIRRMGGHLLKLLRGAAALPDRPIAELEIIGAEERRTLVAEWNDTWRARAPEENVLALIARQVQAVPDARAVSCGGRSLTYGQLDDEAGRLAARLRDRGARPGQVVALCLERSCATIVGLLAILRTGAAYTPLDPRYPRERLSYQLRDSRACLLLTDRALGAELPDTAPHCYVDDTPTSADVVAGPAIPPGATAYVIHTSGSTGQPKGVQVSHANLVNLLLAMQHAPGLTHTDTFVAVTSLAFDIAALELFLPLVCGAHVVMATGEEAHDGARLQQLLAVQGATAMQGTPATWRMLLDAGWRGQSPFKAFCGGELLSDALGAALLERCDEVWNLYGPTETTIWSTAHRLERAAAPRPVAGVPIGRPIANTTALVLDANGALVPMGCAGDLYLGGLGVADGYLHRPALTAQKFVPDPYGPPGARLYHTGDRVVLGEDGVLQFLGRNDHQVKIRGFRIEPGEVEAALARHPSVREAVVVANEAGAGERMLLAYIVAREASSFDAGAVRAALADELPPQAVPSLIIRLDRLPLTPNGKIDRKALPRPSRESLGIALERVAPRDDWERTIHAVWATVLELPELGVHDNFFALGGHSLRATRVAYLLQSALDVDVALIDIFRAPTIASLAERLRERRRASPIAPPAPAAAAAPLPPHEIAPLTAEEAQLLGDL